MQARSIWLAIVAMGLGCGRVGGEHGAPADTAVGNGGAAGNGGSPGSAGTSAVIIEAAGNGGLAGSAGGPASQVTSAPLWRLTNLEFANSVRDLLGVTVSVALDPDGFAGGYSAGVVASDATVDAYHAAAIQVAADALQNSALVPCTAQEISADGAGCAAKFIAGFGPKIFRRPLDSATSAGLNQFFASVSANFGFTLGIQAVLEELLQSPYFLYHLELEERTPALGQVPVTGYSMASRLSYLLWSSTPDEELLAQAAAGTLSTPAQIKAQASRMLKDPKAKLGLRNFYEQWLGVRNLPDSKTGSYAGSYGPALRASILSSFDAQVDDALWADSGGLDHLLAGDRAFADGLSAGLLGVSLVAGAPLQQVTINTSQRLGILMHPALMGTLATEAGSHPIHRGAFIWNSIFCQYLPDPPPNEPPFTGLSSGTSLRHAIEAFDAAPTCQACHARIDPVGFLFENYDTLGTYRTTDDAGQAVDSAVTVSGASDPKLNGPASGAVEFVKRLASNDAVVAQCLAKQLFRFATKRTETDQDAAFLAGLATDYAQSGQSMKEILSAMTQSQSFLTRINEQ